MTAKRKPVVAGNWKMFKCRSEAQALAGAIVEQAGPWIQTVETVLCPPFTALAAVAGCVASTPIGLGAQNMHWESEGAYTGEIAPPMLLDTGCGYVVLGHSERRTLFDESDRNVNRKTLAALACGLTPIVCVGETLAEREDGKTRDVIGKQIVAGLREVGAAMARVIVAYEPVWAIGTGRTATPAQAQDVHNFIRETIGDLLPGGSAAAIRIVYGGSVKPNNAAELFACPDIDGGLIGGAALDAASFLAIVKAAAA